MMKQTNVTALDHDRVSPAGRGRDIPQHDAADEAPRASGGYAFETALCLVESLRLARRQANPAAGSETAVLELADRVYKLTRLLAAVEPSLGGRNRRLLRDVAADVAHDLLARYGDAAQGVADDPRSGDAMRIIAIDALRQCRRLDVAERGQIPVLKVA